MAKGSLQIEYEKLVMDNLELKERIKKLEKENEQTRLDMHIKTDEHWSNGYEIAKEEDRERIKGLEQALESIWPFIEEDFPKGTGNNHGTCASDLYVLAARQIEQARKG